MVKDEIPQITGIRLHDRLINGNRHYSWPTGRAVEGLGLTVGLPPIHNGADIVTWKGTRDGQFSTRFAIALFRRTVAKVTWHTFMVGPMKSPRNSVILWLSIQHKLSTMDKPLLVHQNGRCMLYDDEDRNNRRFGGTAREAEEVATRDIEQMKDRILNMKSKKYSYVYDF
ncbi:hypothetical protein Salat_2891000 [Sesamum alatum]|uniref:Uncharacterized protein n=1 Tax=Sesamum alatum TaxID=300844 RepID=A0AAE1XJA8_9LAMI|nr:hypothetical protein Salat_2891000 [Sesamum alatum]